MGRKAFTMQLLPGKEAEYKQRHDAIWPELKELLRSSGIRDYSIYLDEKSRTLFAYMGTEGDSVAGHPVMKKWWTHMSDIMVTHPDHSPKTTPLKEVFHLP